jgi:RNA polymerase sigma factor (sigma-70 family)
MRSNNSDKNRKNVELASQIFCEYGDFIRSIIHTKVNNQEKEEIIFQDLFLSLVYKPMPPNVRNKKSFLYRAIINDITDFHRRSERYSINIQKYNEKMKTTIKKCPSKNAYINEEQFIRMLKLIKAQLPGSSSEALILRYRDNMSIQEVAKKMNVKTDSVNRYISTGIKKLRRLWKKK